MISPESKKRINELVQSGIKEGANILLDGRNITVPGYEKGNFVGPTILADVTVSERGKLCALFSTGEFMCVFKPCSQI